MGAVRDDTLGVLTSEGATLELGLARAESCVEMPLSMVPADLAGCTITFDVPESYDVWVTCRVPYLWCKRRGAEAEVLLTDEQGRVIDAVGVRAGRGGDLGFVTVDELIPAGSGRVTRKLRGCTSKGTGAANSGGTGTVTMDAYLR